MATFETSAQHVLDQHRAFREEAVSGEASCPLQGVMEHITSRWGVLVLLALLTRARRFTELRADIQGVSHRMLAQTLHTLQADGLIRRTVDPDAPSRVEYSLTRLGREAAVHVGALAGWVEHNAGRLLQARGDAQAGGPAVTRV